MCVFSVEVGRVALCTVLRIEDRVRCMLPVVPHTQWGSHGGGAQWSVQAQLSGAVLRTPGILTTWKKEKWLPDLQDTGSENWHKFS